MTDSGAPTPEKHVEHDQCQRRRRLITKSSPNNSTILCKKTRCQVKLARTEANPGGWLEDARGTVVYGMRLASRTLKSEYVSKGELKVDGQKPSSGFSLRTHGL